MNYSHIDIFPFKSLFRRRDIYFETSVYNQRRCAHFLCVVVVLAVVVVLSAAGSLCWSHNGRAWGSVR